MLQKGNSERGKKNLVDITKKNQANSPKNEGDKQKGTIKILKHLFKILKKIPFFSNIAI